MMRVWYHNIGRTTLDESSLADTFNRCNVDLTPFRSNSQCGPGILFFDRSSDEVFDFILESSHSGNERVIAISVNQLLSETGAWQLIQSGASDVILLKDLEEAAKKVSNRLTRWDTVDKLLSSSLIQGSIIGESAAWKTAIRQIVEVAHFTNAAFLITGESGTGKEMVARLIHALDPRPKKGELKILDCTTIVPELSGSEFFGHERGAFTGAHSAREGAFELANGGTLFLDEVGELPLKLQAQLLRVIQEKMFKRIGGNSWYKTDFRLICATNRDLQKALHEGAFRSDLYYRIANWTCALPPLRSRKEDILLLVNHFMKDFISGMEMPQLDEPLKRYFIEREYPGNVRDLKQLVSSIMYKYVGPGPVTAGDIPEAERPSGICESPNWCDNHFEASIMRALLVGVGLKDIGRTAENIAIRLAVRQEQGNLKRAAQKLGVTDRTLQMRRPSQSQRTTDSPFYTIDDTIPGTANPSADQPSSVNMP